jgi:hypothetical protein
LDDVHEYGDPLAFSIDRLTAKYKQSALSENNPAQTPQ